MVSRLGEGDGFGSASSSILNLRADLSRKRSVLGRSTKLKLRLSVSYTSHHRTIRKQARSKTNRLQQDRGLTRLHLDLIHNKIEQAHPATRRRPPPRAATPVAALTRRLSLLQPLPQSSASAGDLHTPSYSISIL